MVKKIYLKKIQDMKIVSNAISILLKLLMLLPVADVLSTSHDKTRDTQCFAFIQKKADHIVNFLQINSNHSSNYHYETNSNSVGGESLSTYLLMSQQINGMCQIWTSNSLQISPDSMDHFVMTQQNTRQVLMTRRK